MAYEIWGEEMGIPDFGIETREREFEDLCIHGRVITRCILKESGQEGVDWTDLAKDREKWWTVVNVVINR